MASFRQPPFFSSLIPINNISFAFPPQPNNSLTFKTSKISSSIQENSAESRPDEEDTLKFALARGMANKNSTESGTETPKSAQGSLLETYAEIGGKNDDLPTSDEVKDADVGKDVPSAVKLALEKANKYKKNKGVVDGDSGGVGGTGILSSGGNEKIRGDKQPIKKKGELKISSMDFVGLGFSDKKSSRYVPAGLVPQPDLYPEGKFPEVEILVGDTSRFSDTSAAPETSPVEENDADLYKPKVSTWGVFPRPNDISKAYGGGRTLRPGEALETAEERAAKQERTRQMVAAYKRRIGGNIDPKLKSECEKALKDGDSLMDLGKLKDALPFYERVMEKLEYQTELHGLAALQWSICQDSLCRANEARGMYEKLQSHPSAKVNKKAKHLYFGFQAMEMLKVKSMDRSPRSTGYQNYFDAFVEDKTNYQSKEDQVDEGGLNQAIPYVIFLVSPILMVFLIAISRP